jgi:hypothetical protein
METQFISVVSVLDPHKLLLSIGLHWQRFRKSSRDQTECEGKERKQAAGESVNTSTSLKIAKGKKTAP